MDPLAQAMERLQAKRRFQRHALIYAVVIGLLVVIWALTNFGNYFWPIRPALVWGSPWPSMPGRCTGGGPSPTPTSTGSWAATTDRTSRPTGRHPWAAHGGGWAPPAWRCSPAVHRSWRN
jgi:hypothetical protein